ncbi:unnamed protein product [Darwinula stevensoni]|uniref:EF-hand domain-containing protein n=1 Tax=Darwinula stevensoni TaxID=69355 RepID=A0A7R9A3B6_9CRUS|nr:unnamed protein product [Darwinula stevensoni]CAG0880991.1 unnamed protein product [Darwinula stevensoni]
MEKLKAAFTMLDANKDGRVNASELQSMLKRLGIHIQEEFTQELIKAASPSENGLINETEFLQWMGKLTCTSSSSEASADDVSEDLIAAFRVFDKDRNGFITKE